MCVRCCRPTICRVRVERDSDYVVASPKEFHSNDGRQKPKAYRRCYFLWEDKIEPLDQMEVLVQAESVSNQSATD